MVLKRRKIGCWLVLFVLLLGVGLYFYLRSLPLPFGAKFPPGVDAEFILRFDDASAAQHSVPVGFNVDKSGHPYLLVGRTFIAVKYSDDSNAEAIPLPAGETISDFAWMSDGTLFLIESKRLMELTSEGLKLVQTLPQAGMQLAPASTDQCYLFGGTDSEQRTNLYLFRRSGTLLHLMKAEAPITAVTGNGDITFVAINDGIYALAPDRPLTLVCKNRYPVSSLALGPEFCLFYSTSDGVYFSKDRGNSERFVQGRSAKIQVRDNLLYLFFPDIGIMKCSPVGRFLQATNPDQVPKPG